MDDLHNYLKAFMTFYEYVESSIIMLICSYDYKVNGLNIANRYM